MRVLTVYYLTEFVYVLSLFSVSLHAAKTNYCQSIVLLFITLYAAFGFWVGYDGDCEPEDYNQSKWKSLIILNKIPHTIIVIVSGIGISFFQCWSFLLVIVFDVFLSDLNVPLYRKERQTILHDE